MYADVTVFPFVVSVNSCVGDVGSDCNQSDTLYLLASLLFFVTLGVLFFLSLGFYLTGLWHREVLTRPLVCCELEYPSYSA